MASTNDRASLLGLPNEIRSKIYSYVFSGSYAIFCKSKGVDVQPSLNRKTDSSYLDIQLISKSFYHDASLYKMFLYASTVFVSNDDIDLLRSHLSAEDLKLIRHVCIRPERREVIDQFMGGTGRTRLMFSFECSLMSILKVMPNVRTMTARRDHVHINTFNHELRFGLEALFLAIDRNCRSFDALLAAKHVEIQELATMFQLPTMDLDRSSREYSKAYSSSRGEWTVKYAELCRTNDTLHLRNISLVLTHCVIRTATKFGSRWYYNYLYETLEHGIELLFEVNLMFRGIGEPWYGGRKEAGDQEIKGIQISSEDWVLRFAVNGKSYAFEQVTPFGTWKEWIRSELEQCGGLMNPKIEANAGPVAKKQRST